MYDVVVGLTDALVLPVSTAALPDLTGSSKAVAGRTFDYISIGRAEI